MTTALAVAGALCVSAPAGAATTTDGTVVREWTDLAFAAVRSNNLSDARAARLYAMVDAAMYDAVNATGGGPPRAAAIVAAQHAPGDPSAAAAGAAHDVLAALFPASAATYDAQLAADLAAVPARPQAERGRESGAQVAQGVLAARAADGSQGTDETQPGDPALGKFENPWSGVQFRNLAPFAIADPSVYVGPGPPPLGSPEYMDALNTTRVLGGATPADPDKRATYDFWALGGKTNQPPGAWLQVAEAVSQSRGLDLADTARLFALESMAMADTVAPTYTTKFVFHSWRPTRAIRTLVDPAWTSRSGSAGGTPEYFSGHSTFSSAGATVLAGFFCDDAVPFSLTTDPTGGIPTGTRSYDSFSSAAAEAGISRVYGGLHFPFSNQDAAAAGRAVGAEVLRTALLREHGPAHDGTCPR
jgi:hypothetical protein